MAKKLQLIEETDYKSEYEAVGICSHLKDYRLSWYLNDRLRLDLKKMKDLDFDSNKKSESVKFSIYYYDDKDNRTVFYFISNRSTGGVLIPEQKFIDYFLLIKKTGKKQLAQSILKNIKDIPNVLTVYNIDLSLIRNVNDILLDLEMRMLEIIA